MLALAFVSCGNEAPKELMTPSGYKYKHIKTGAEKGAPGDFISFSLLVEGSDGSILQDMPEGPGMPVVQIPKPDNPIPQQSNPLVEALENAGVGDTLEVIMPMDSLPRAKNNPQFANLEYMKYLAVVVSIEDEATKKAKDEALRLEQEAAAEESKKRIPEVETMIAKTLKDYKSGKLKTEKLDSGLKYVIHEQGTEGELAQNGQTVSVDYYGITTDGKMFDNSFRRGAPYTFPLGKGQVIKGWDLGIPLLKEGGKATLFIPYELGYGEAGSPPNIGPKAELVFYVELTKIK